MLPPGSNLGWCQTIMRTMEGQKRGPTRDWTWGPSVKNPGPRDLWGAGADFEPLSLQMVWGQTVPGSGPYLWCFSHNAWNFTILARNNAKTGLRLTMFLHIRDGGSKEKLMQEFLNNISLKPIIKGIVKCTAESPFIMSTAVTINSPMSLVKLSETNGEDWRIAYI